MSTYKKTSFENSDEIDETKSALDLMDNNSAYNTLPSFSANTERYPNNLIPFTEKHIQYLLSHKNINLQHYLANLRLITKIK